MVDLIPLISTSVQAILQVACTCIFGFVLMRYKVISKDLLKGVSQLNISFFTPCLLFTKMVINTNLTTLISMWPIPVIYFVAMGVSILVAHVGSKLLGLSDSKRRFATFASIFSNSNSLPMSLIQSIALSSVAHHLLWDQDDTLEEIEGRGITYIVMFAAFSNIVRWSFGVTLLKDPENVELDQDKQIESQVESGLANSSESTPLVKNNQVQQPKNLSMRIEALYKNFLAILNPPLIAIFASIFVVAIPGAKGLLYGESAPLGALAQAIKVCSGAAIPIILLGLGCNISTLVKEARPVNFKMIGLVLVNRFLLSPLIVISLLLLAQPWFYLGDDPVFVLVIMILVSSPTAINLLQVCQSVHKFEDEMSMLLLYSYILAIPVTTALVTFYLFIIQKISF